MSIKLRVYVNEEFTELNVKKGENLLDVLRTNGFNVNSPCGGNKTCGKCKVNLIAGEAPVNNTELELLSEEEIESGCRMACAITIISDITIELPEEEQLQIVTEGVKFSLDYDPSIQIHRFGKEVKRDNNSSYLDIIKDLASIKDISLSVIQQFSEKGHQEDLSLLSYNDRIIAVGDTSLDKVYGLAVDIGTTTVVMYLINLFTGEEIDLEAFPNPQKKYGADVISRINHIQQAESTIGDVQEAIITGLNWGIGKLISRNKIKSDDIYLLTAVGNTIMLHFLLGVNPVSIAMAPYRPVFTDLLELTAAEVELDMNPTGIVQVLPSVSGYVGADIIADLLITDFDNEDWNLLIDIGTNGEIVLGNKHRMLACSAAAGPAFEGANISFGVAGIPGAISEFKISENQEFVYKTISDRKPLGICGSGLIDIIAEMLNKNILSSTGAFNENPKFQDKLTVYKNQKAFEIVDARSSALDRPILLTQKDVRELQLAKGAIAAAINVLLKEADIKYQDISKIYLAGGFGSYIRPANACRIGLLPSNMEDKIIKVGNGAGLGARTYLLDKKQREKAEDLIGRIEYLELSLNTDFQNEFMKSMEF